MIHYARYRAPESPNIYSKIFLDTKLNYDHYTSSIHIIENLDFIEEKTDFHAKTVELHENAHSGPHGPLLARFP